MTKPDFKTWAANIVEESQLNGSARETIETALSQAFEQGYSYGLNFGWAIERDDSFKGRMKC